MNISNLRGMTIIFVIIFKLRCVRSCSNDDVQDSSDGWKADCLKMGLTKFPTNLRLDLKVLDISENPIRKLSKAEVSVYYELEQFFFNGHGHTFDPLKVEPDAFEELMNLKVLHLGFHNLLGIKLFVPYSTISLFLPDTGIKTEDINFYELPQLGHCVLDFNKNLTTFPKFNRFAPLYWLSFTETSIQRVPPEKIARYCQIKYLFFNITANMAMVKDPCECPRLKEWLNMRRVKGSSWDFECLSAMKCNETLITPLMNYRYNNCVNKIEDEYDWDPDEIPPKPKFKWKRLLIPLIVFIVAIIIACLIYIIIRRKKEEPKKEELPLPSDEEIIEEGVVEEEQQEKL